MSEECESVQTKIENQMFEWYSEENCGEIIDDKPNGQKCLYRVKDLMNKIRYNFHMHDMKMT